MKGIHCLWGNNLLVLFPIQALLKTYNYALLLSLLISNVIGT